MLKTRNRQITVHSAHINLEWNLENLLYWVWAGRLSLPSAIDETKKWLQFVAALLCQVFPFRQQPKKNFEVRQALRATEIVYYYCCYFIIQVFTELKQQTFARKSELFTFSLYIIHIYINIFFRLPSIWNERLFSLLICIESTKIEKSMYRQ